MALGPAITLGDLKTVYHYDDKLIGTSLTGNQLILIVNHFLRLDNRNPDGDFYQVSSSVRAEYDTNKRQLKNLFINGTQVENDSVYSACFEEYHFINIERKLNLPKEEVENLHSRTIASSCRDILIEYFRTHQNLSSKPRGRLIDIS